jgi:opacity protein-like surface antigen
MRKFFPAILACLTPVGAALAADLPPRAAVKVVPVATYGSPFYLIFQAGAGASSNQNELTIPGLAIQGASPKEWPTGFLLGTGVGIETSVTPIGKFQGELKVNYDFTAASFGCSPLPGAGCAGHMRNGLLLQEMLYWSPVVAPLSFTGWQWTQGVGVYGGVGAAQRRLDVCLSNFDGTNTCDSAWLAGLDLGAKVEIPITSSVKARITYDWVDYQHRVVHVDSLVFTSAFSPDKEHLFLAGLDFHF